MKLRPNVQNSFAQAVRQLESNRVLQSWIDQGADPRHDNDHVLRSELFYKSVSDATQAKALRVMSWLVDQGCDPHVLEEALLRRAAQRGYHRLVENLIQRSGTNIQAANNNALFWALAAHHWESALLLLEHGAQSQSIRQVIKVEQLVQESEEVLLHYLLNQNTDLIQDFSTDRILKAALCQPKMLFLLLEFGAPVETAITLAVEQKKVEVELELRRWKAKQERKDLEGAIETPSLIKRMGPRL